MGQQLLALLRLGALLCTAAKEPARSKKKHIVYMFADDLGWNDV